MFSFLEGLHFNYLPADGVLLFWVTLVYHDWATNDYYFLHKLTSLQKGIKLDLNWALTENRIKHETGHILGFEWVSNKSPRRNQTRHQVAKK